ncbi:MAG: class I SAM-dependent methyltransferase [Deltaproteobacteria bacterium]|nr:class I SAM-dependent methyltransferase [Deltaproteobacteria bacterium]
MQSYQVKTPLGDVPCHILHPHKFGGEYQKQSTAYAAFIWIVSMFSCVTNVSEALFKKAFNGLRGAPLDRVLWEMGRDPNHFSCLFCDRFSRHNHRAKWGAAGWQSLDLFYNYHEKTKPLLKNDWEGFLTRFYIERMENRQAVTNRFKIVVDLLAENFDRLSGESEIRLLSIASGSAQAVISAMLKKAGLNVRALLIDADAKAIAEAKRLANEAGLCSRFDFLHGSTKALEEAAAEFRPHIIEMVGFLDYLPDDKAASLIKRINKQLPDGGVFITCNIRKNCEKIFLDWLLLWPMVYRNEEKLVQVLLDGGFSPDGIRLVYEPFKIHGIAVCRK